MTVNVVSIAIDKVQDFFVLCNSCAGTGIAVK